MLSWCKTNNHHTRKGEIHERKKHEQYVEEKFACKISKQYISESMSPPTPKARNTIAITGAIHGKDQSHDSAINL